ncbi:hypothetical protein ACA910_004918 [Epithemia clementina (nom. ined.)]
MNGTVEANNICKGSSRPSGRATSDSGDNNEELVQLSSSMHDFFYLSDEAVRNLPHFQYRGKDLSLLYRYILSPLAVFCVNHLTPSWVAPNAITLTGLLIMFSAYGAVWYYVPDLEIQSDPPRWIFLWTGIAMLLYQTLDNMDGKHAVKTKSASPLGLLFDHGVDAINSIFGSANWIITLMLHPVHDAALCFACVFGPYGMFFISTWEEYHTGELIMPIINGPSEGLLSGAMMHFVSWWAGPQFWQQTTTWDDFVIPFILNFVPSFLVEWLPTNIRNGEIIVLVSSFGIVQEMILKIRYVVRTFGVQSTVCKLLPFVTLVVCALAVGFVDLDIWVSMPRTNLHLGAALFVEMTTELMAAHITHTEYKVGQRWILLPLVAFTLVVCFGWIKAGVITDNFLLIYASSALTFLGFKFAVVIHEVCQVLNIWCFDITTPRPTAVQRMRQGDCTGNHSKKTAKEE